MYNKDKLFKIIAERKISNKELSTAVGVSAGNIGDWKSGRSKPNLDAITKIADYLDCSVDYLLGRTKEVHTNDIIELKEETPEETELLRIFRDASIKDRVMLMNYAYNIENKNTLVIPELELKAAKDDEVE